MPIPDTYRYPLDTTGVHPDNLVRDEEHTLSGINGDNYYVIFPRVGPFFQTGVVIRHPITDEPLEVGKDYIFTHTLEQLSIELNRNVSVSITLLDRTLNGTLVIEYQTLGGEYQIDQNLLLKELSEMVLFIDTRTFDEIYNTPEAYPSIDHTVDAEDLTGMSEVVEAVDRLTDAISGNYPGNHTHTVEQIIGLDEAITNMASNQGNHKFAPCEGLTVIDFTGSLCVLLPQFVVDTRVKVELCIISKELPCTLTVSGLVKSRLDSTYGDSWEEGKVRFTGTEHVKEAWLSYNEDNFPVIYLGDHVEWKDVHMVIQNVTIDSSIPQKYQKGWGLFTSNGVNGESINVERIEELDTLHRKVKMLSANTLFDKPIFDII